MDIQHTSPSSQALALPIGASEEHSLSDRGTPSQEPGRAIPDAPPLPLEFLGSIPMTAPTAASFGSGDLKLVIEELADPDNRVHSTQALPEYPGIAIGRMFGNIGNARVMTSPTEFVDHMRLVREALSNLAASGKNGVAHQLMRCISDNAERDLERQKKEMASSADGGYRTHVRSVTINAGKDGVASTFSGLRRSQPGRGDASAITIDLAEWDPTTCRSTRPLALDDVPTDLYLDRHAQLGHELCHALANQLGLSPASFVTELMTVGLVPGYRFTENRIREDMGMPSRRCYSGFKADEAGRVAQATSREAYLSMTRLGSDPGLLFKSLRVGADLAFKEKSPELQRAAIERVQALARQVQAEIQACGWRNRGIDDLLAVDAASGDLSRLAAVPPDAWWTFSSVESST